MNFIVNDKIFAPNFDASNETNVVITDKELYSTLYNSLVNTNTIAYIKTLPTNKKYLFSIPTVYTDDKENVISFRFFIDSVLILSVYNR